MGLDLLSFLKTKVSRDQKYAFTSTFFISLLIHLYKFVNTLHNDAVHLIVSFERKFLNVNPILEIDDDYEI